MDQKGTNPYSTEIPVEEAEKQLSGPSLSIPTSPSTATPPSPTPSAPSSPSSNPPVSSPTPPPPPVSNKFSLIPKVIIGILILLIVLLSTYILTARMGAAKTPPKTTTTPTKVPTPTHELPTATPTPGVATTSANPTSNRYYSQELGIYFDYAKSLPDSPKQTLEAEADASRVYVFFTGSAPTNGQYVDVMSKLTTDSTLQAVSKITMSDPNYAGCTFSFKAQTPYPSTYEEIIPTCPTKQSTNLTFFLGDSAHPDKLLFFSIGSTSIPSSSNPQVTWQDTLRFL